MAATQSDTVMNKEEDLTGQQWITSGAAAEPPPTEAESRQNDDVPERPRSAFKGNRVQVRRGR